MSTDQIGKAEKLEPPPHRTLAEIEAMSDEERREFSRALVVHLDATHEEWRRTMDEHIEAMRQAAERPRLTLRSLLYPLLG